MHKRPTLLLADYFPAWGLTVVLAALQGCQPAPPPPPPVDVPMLIKEVERVLPEIKAELAEIQARSDKAKAQLAEFQASSDKATAEFAQATTKSNPLKDVAAPGPVVPYFNPLSVAEAAEGWISLFDGHSLFGWEPNDKGVNWSIADGSITADSGPKGLLLTYTPFADYQFRCDFQMAAGGNSGVFLRSLADPQSVETDCYEVNIVDEHPAGFLTGSIVALQKTAEPIQGSGGWHTLLLTADGTKITVTLDGKEVAVYDDTRPDARRSGLIGLQKNEGKIEFKNIALKPLNQKPLFNGTDLSGWRVVPGSEGEFTFEDGTIRVKGGEGFLESETQHKDFALQAQARTNAEDVNTGIFFRAEAGTEKAKSNGYEMQVDNSLPKIDISDSDLDIPFRSGSHPFEKPLPANAGTGAIFRRVNARCVVASDKEWATVTLIASGPRFSTYVNGYAVVHWEDTRKLDPNPRKGLRLDAGHFSLQGHDPGTNASFQVITVSDLP